MIPHILIEPELIHLFSSDQERDDLCKTIIDILQSLIRAECAVVTNNMFQDAYGLRVIPAGKLDDLCEKITPKLDLLLSSFIESSIYTDKLASEVVLTRNRLDVYLTAKYYTGISSSIH
jgi:hypothetical protein